jgi:hypothetical protein
MKLTKSGLEQLIKEEVKMSRFNPFKDIFEALTIIGNALDSLEERIKKLEDRL